MMEPLKRPLPFTRPGEESAAGAEAPAPPSPETIPGEAAAGREGLREAVIEALHTVRDPELPADIVELGLIYRCDVDAEGRVAIDMTLTAPACPVAQTFPGQVEERIRQVDGVAEARVTLVWDPPWCRDRMSQAARLAVELM